MKKFSSIEKYVKPKYESKDSLKKEIYNIIDNEIALKVTNESKIDSDIDIHGKDELVEKIKELIDDVRIKERTLTLEIVKTNVHRNFDLKWLNEQIDILKNLKTKTNVKLTEDIQELVDIENEEPIQPVQPLQNSDIQEEDDNDVLDINKEKNNAGVAHYIAKKMNDVKKIGDFNFEYEPSDGILRFVNDNEGIIVKATPFYTEDDELPIEVFDENQVDTHIFIENRNFDINEMAFEKYKEIMDKFLVDEFGSWVDRVNKFDEKGGDEPQVQ